MQTVTTTRAQPSKVILRTDAPTVSVSWFAPGVLEVAWTGQVDGENIRLALSEALKVSATTEVTHVIATTTKVIGYSVDVRAPAMEFMRAFRERGAAEFIGIMPQTALRMLATAVSRVVGMRFPVFKNREDAELYIRNAKQARLATS